MAKILIVDDEPSCRDATRVLLSGEGFEVETAADGREALEAAKRFLPDVLLVDWMLRDKMDGLEVARAVRATIPGMRTIVITGYLSPDLEERIEQVPFTRHLTKPVPSGELIAAVRKAADRFSPNAKEAGGEMCR